jgi:hypothetical protein
VCRWLLAAWGYKAFALLPVLNLFGLVLGVGMTILGKWLFIGRYKEGEHPIWGWHYIRHWLANQFVVVSNVCACCTWRFVSSSHSGLSCSWLDT